MSGPQPFRGYPSRSAYALACRDSGMKIRQIAVELGCTQQAVCSLVKGAERAERKRLTIERLEPHARRRKIATSELCDRLLAIIADDGMVDAVLDDLETGCGGHASASDAPRARELKGGGHQS